MLAEPLVAEVRRLLAEPGLSQRKISLLTGVSRASISAIASGRRPDYVPPADGDDCEEQEEVGHGPVGRCPTCGGRVYLPCRLCRVRALKAQERKEAAERLAGGNQHGSPPFARALAG